MTKKNGIISLLVIAVLLAVGIYTALFGLDANKTGSAYNIKQGLDLAGGVSITYQVVGDEEPSAEDMSNILQDLNEDQKFLLFLWALRQYSSPRIAAIKGQSDRNIRKVRNTMLKKIRKKLLEALTKKVKAQQPLTLLEKDFLIDNGVSVE